MVYFIISFLLILFLLWQYVIQVYEIRYRINVDSISISKDESAILEVTPLNSLGKPAMLRKVKNLEIDFLEGRSLIDLVYLDDGNVLIKPLGDTGYVTFLVDSEFSLSSSRITLSIES